MRVDKLRASFKRQNPNSDITINDYTCWLEQKFINDKLEIIPLTNKQIIQEGTQGIVSRVAKMAGITQSELLTPSRKEKFMFPRQLAHAIAHRYLFISHSEMALGLGGCHRTNIVWSARAVKKLLKTNKYFAYEYEEIIKTYRL